MALSCSYIPRNKKGEELKGFQKVHLAAGQSAQVDFTITADELSYYDHDLRWVCEPGDFDIFIGPDCQRGEAARLTVTE